MKKKLIMPFMSLLVLLNGCVGENNNTNAPTTTQKSKTPTTLLVTNTTSLDLGLASGVANSLGYSQYAAMIDTFGLITGLSASTGPTNSQIMDAIKGLSTQLSDVQTKTQAVITMLDGINNQLLSNSQNQLTNALSNVNSAYNGYSNLFQYKTESGATVSMDMATFIQHFDGTKVQAVATIYNALNNNLSLTDNLDAITNVSDHMSSRILGIINNYQSYLQDYANQASWLKSDFFQLYQNYAQLISGDIVNSIVAIEQARSYSLAIVEYNYKYANTTNDGDLPINIPVKCMPLTSDMTKPDQIQAYNACMTNTNNYYNNLESAYGAATQIAVNSYNNDTVNSALQQVNQSWYNQWKQTCIPGTTYAKNIVAGGAGLVKDDGYTVSEYCPALKTSSDISNCGSGPDVSTTIDGHEAVFWDPVKNMLKCRYVNPSDIGAPVGFNNYISEGGDVYYKIFIEPGITNMWISNTDGDDDLQGTPPYSMSPGHDYHAIFMDNLDRYFYLSSKDGNISLHCPDSEEGGYCNEIPGRSGPDGNSKIQFSAASGSCTIYRVDGGGNHRTEGAYIYSLPCGGSSGTQPLPSGDWVNTCDTANTVYPTNSGNHFVVMANCQDVNQNYQISQIYADQCGGQQKLTNRDGVLMCDSDSKPANILGGNWSDSCAYVKYDPNTHLLSAFCGDGGDTMTSIDVNSCGGRGAQNDHGVLKCN